ncbi:MAG: hypothetical protein ACE37K_19305 [Planctomycetota bacterium]
MQSVSKGPALREVEPDDDTRVRAVLAEQRAMLDVVRGNRVWDWLGGMPSGFGHPKAGLYGIYLAVAFVVMAAIALVVAGFDRGVWLATFVGLALVCLLVRAVVEGSAERRTKAFYGRAVQMPAVVLHAQEPDDDGDDDEPATPVALLVGTDVSSADDLAALLEAGARLRAGIEDPDACEPALVELARTIRDGRECDGSRMAAPEALGKAMDVAFVAVFEDWLPERELDSRLVFVLADPDRRDARHTRVAHHAAWGPGAVNLCARLPLEVEA